MTASLSEGQAFDLVMARFKAAWEANAPAIVGYVPQILWPDTTTTEVAAGKIIVKLVFAVPTKKRRNIGQPAWYVYTGSFFAIILSPLNSVATTHARQLADVVKNAFQGQNEQQALFYREVVAIPFPAEGAWHRYRAEVRFEGNERV